MSFLPVFKCSVSCGIGIQVRKVECISTINANGQSIDYLNGNSSGIVSISDDNERHSSTAAIAATDADNGESTGQLLQCDPKTKPIAKQSCTTGIECSIIITTNDNSDNVSSNGEGENVGGGIDQTKNTDEDAKHNDNADEMEEIEEMGEAEVFLDRKCFIFLLLGMSELCYYVDTIFLNMCN